MSEIVEAKTVKTALIRQRKTPLFLQKGPPVALSDGVGDIPLEPDHSDAVVRTKPSFGLGDAIAGTFLLAGAMLPGRAMARPPAVVQMVEVSQELTEDVAVVDIMKSDAKIAQEGVEQIFEHVDEADIAPMLIKAVKEQETLKVEISIETDGSDEQIKAVQDILRAIDEVDLTDTEDHSVWAVIRDDVVPAMKTTGTILGALWGSGKVVIYCASVVGIDIATKKKTGEDGNSILVVSGKTAKSQEPTKYANGVKSAGDMSKALSSIANGLELLAEATSV